MSTIDLTAKAKNHLPRRMVTQYATLTYADRGDGVAPVSADVHQLFSLPAGAEVLRTWYTPITSFNEGTSATLSIGDGASATRYLSGANIKSVTANTPVPGTAYWRYASADTVDAIITYGGGTACTTGEVRVGITWVNPADKEPYA